MTMSVKSINENVEESLSSQLSMLKEEGKRIWREFLTKSADLRLQMLDEYRQVVVREIMLNAELKLKRIPANLRNSKLGNLSDSEISFVLERLA